jgi:hypothetical protein
VITLLAAVLAAEEVHFVLVGVSVRTSFGRLDCLLERGRRDWGTLRAGARPFDVSGARVLAAGADDIRLLRARFKDGDDD